MMNKTSALDQIAVLAEQYALSIDDIAARLNETQTPEKQGNILKMLLGYTGGIFVFSGIGLLVSMVWDDISPLQHVIVTFGIGLAAFILGIAAVKDQRFDKAATPLFLVAALLQPFGLFVYLDEFYPHGNNPELAAMFVFGTIAAQQALSFWSLKRPSLLFITYFFWTAFIGTTMTWLDFADEAIGILCGLSMLCLSWTADQKGYRSITPFWYFFGAAFLLVSFWAFVEGGPLDLIYLGLNSFLVYLSIKVASRTLLFVSVIGLLSYLSYFTYEYFADVIGWPIALIVMGLVMIGLSAYAVKLGQKIRRTA